MLVRHQLGIVLAGNKPRDGLHRSRAVQGDDGGDVLNVLGLQPHAHAGHTGGLDLEYAGGLPAGDHLIRLRIVIGDVR